MIHWESEWELSYVLSMYILKQRLFSFSVSPSRAVPRYVEHVLQTLQ